ncbi:DMT family transporter [Hoeflea poritis]|uniref:DMT family transporter n=1 Tax=Hoeflea poritis TaxID=2993659 RepID=A0ABT4VWE1_9HYPH|nr:DMT family transporter [Hoeflea poritis]MDA4848535.1 DMT family transporter [Hoeflea poritis]
MLSDNNKGALFMMSAMAVLTAAEAIQKTIGSQIPLFQMLFIRSIMGCVLLIPLSYVIGPIQFPADVRTNAILFIRSLGDVGASFAYLAAIISIPLANARAIVQILPLVMSLCAFFFLGERLGWRRISAILVGLFGVLLIVKPGSEGFGLPALLVLCAVGFSVVRDLGTRFVRPDINSLTVAAYATLMVAVCSGIASAFTAWDPVSVTQIGLIFVAAISLLAVYLFLILAMRYGQITFVAMFRYTGLLWAIFAGFIVFGDWPDSLTFVGAMLIVGSGVFVVYRERRLGQNTASRSRDPLT